MINSLHSYIKIVDESVKELHKNLSLEKGDSLVSFRGEKIDFGDMKLTPSIFRENLSDNELKLKEISMINTLNDMRITNSSFNYLETLMLSQHYSIKSRLLDITFNCITALYFALFEYKDCIYCDELESHPVVYTFVFPIEYTANTNFVNFYYENLLNNGSKKNEHDNFKIIKYNRSNERIVAQDGGFIFFESNDFCTIPEIYYKEIQITSNLIEIKGILDEIETLFNIRLFSIFPETDKYGNYVNNQKISKIYDDKIKYTEDDIKMAEIEFKKRYLQTYVISNYNTGLELKKEICTGLELKEEICALKNELKRDIRRFRLNEHEYVELHKFIDKL